MCRVLPVLRMYSEQVDILLVHAGLTWLAIMVTVTPVVTLKHRAVARGILEELERGGIR